MSKYDKTHELDDPVNSDGDFGFIGFNNRVRPDQLPAGMLADSQNIRLDLNGEAQVRKGLELIIAPISTGVDALTLPFYLVADDSTIVVTQTAGELVITNIDAANFPNSGSIILSGVTGITPDPNGIRTFVKDSSTQITISDNTYAGTAAGTATVKFAILNDAAINSIYGSCGFSDPNDNSSQYIIVATNSTAIAINVFDSSTTTITYPTGILISQSVDLLQANNKVFIFRDGAVALQWDGDISGGLAFTEVPNGDYTQPVSIVASSNTVIADGRATVSAVAHNLSIGDRIYIVNAGLGPLLQDGASFYTIESIPTADIFTFRATVEDTAAHTVEYMKKQSVGLGFSHMPSPPWAVYFGWRLVMPYRYEMSGTSGSPTITSRGIFDELIVSDILDYDTYDRIYAQFRFNAGTADYIVGALGFSDDQFLVLNRNSIHLVRASGNSPETASSELVTNEVGCVARRSIVQVGNQIIFLSDNGVYSTSFIDEYNLRGTETPLSEPINSTIQQINKDAWGGSIAVYYDNRYYIAVPLNNSVTNNAILIFNFLNKAWESIDTFNDENFTISNLIISGDGDARGIYCVTGVGAIQRIGQRIDGIDRIIPQVGSSGIDTPVESSITTRQYTLGSMDRKKWRDFELHVQSNETNTSNFDISIETENPDSVEFLGSIEDYNGSALAADEDLSIRGRIGERGYGIQFTCNNTSGRPRIRSLKVDGSISFRSTNKAI